MNRRVDLILSLAGFILIASGLIAADGGHPAMSLVGTWDVERQMLFPEGPDQKVISVFHFGGTAVTTPAIVPGLSIQGSWRKMNGRTFVVTFYLPIIDDSEPPQLVGYSKALVENTLIDKDTFEGRTEVWFLVGTDPLNPLDTFFVEASEDVGRRLKAEGPP